MSDLQTRASLLHGSRLVLHLISARKGEKRNKSETLEASQDMLRGGMPAERTAKYTKLSAEYIMDLGRQQKRL